MTTLALGLLDETFLLGFRGPVGGTSPIRHVRYILWRCHNVQCWERRLLLGRFGSGGSGSTYGCHGFPTTSVHCTFRFSSTVMLLFSSWWHCRENRALPTGFLSRLQLITGSLNSRISSDKLLIGWPFQKRKKVRKEQPLQCQTVHGKAYRLGCPHNTERVQYSKIWVQMP